MGDKGGGYEREISKELSLWWTQGDRDDVFWRTSQSGGRAKTRIYTGKNTAYAYGDITFTDPIGKPLLDRIVIEAKRGYTNTSRKLKRSKIEELVKKIQSAAMMGDRKRACNAVQATFSKAKKGGGVDLLSVIDDPESNKTLMGWIERALMDCALAGVPWFALIFRRDGKQSCILCPAQLHDRMCSAGVVYGDAYSYYIRFFCPLGEYSIMSFEHWQKWVDPEKFATLEPHCSVRIR